MLSKKRKMMIGVAVVVVGILIGGTFAWNTLRNNEPCYFPVPVLYMKLELSKPPALNETVNITLTIITTNQSGGMGAMIGGIKLLPDYADGLEWVDGNHWFRGEEIWDKCIENTTYDEEGIGHPTTELNETYLKYKRISKPGYWSGVEEYLSLSGKIKATRAGNWTVIGFLWESPGGCIPSGNITFNPETGSVHNTWKYAYITINVTEENSSIIKERYIEDGRYHRATHETKTNNKAQVFSNPLTSFNPLKINISMTQNPLINQTADINCNISSAVDLSNITTKILLPKEGIEVVQGNISQQLNLKQNTSTEFTLRVKLTELGNWAVDAYAISGDMGARASIYIYASENGTQVSHIPPFSDNSTILWLEPSTPNSTTDTKSVGTKSAGQIKVTGNLFYEDPNDAFGVMPLYRIRVEVYDYFTNTLRATCYTDANGHYESGWIGNYHDIWLEFATLSDKIEVKREYCAAPKKYCPHTAGTTLFDVSDGIVDVGNITIPPYPAYQTGGFKVYGYLVQGLWYMKEGEASWDVPSPAVTCIWTEGHDAKYYGTGCVEGSHYHPDTCTIHIADGDEASPFAVLHEYGHHVMNKAMGMPCEGGEHDWHDELSPEMAWMEGWADFFPCPVREWVAQQYGKSSVQEPHGGYCPEYPDGSSAHTGIGPDTFAVEWTGELMADEDGTYTFYLIADEGARLWIDNYLLIDALQNSVMVEKSKSKYLTAGWHSIFVQYYDNTGDAMIKVYWQSPSMSEKEILPYSHLRYYKYGTTLQGMWAKYYDDIDSPTPTFEGPDYTINFVWGPNGPNYPPIGPDTFSVRWIGKVRLDYSETYTFSAYADDGVRLWVDGEQIINDWTDVSGLTLRTGQITRNAGLYTVKMEYYENTGPAGAQLAWCSPSMGATQTIPPEYLYHLDYLGYPLYSSERGYIKGGLLGYYYDNKDLTNLKMIRVDPQIKFSGWSDYSPTYRAYPLGDRNEIRVAATLYDLYDANDDGMDIFGEGGFSLIWDTMKIDKPNNFAEFWNAFKARCYGSSIHRAKSAIFWNTIDYNNAPACTVSNLGTEWYTGTITLNATASDQDSEDSSYLQVEFQYSTDRVTWIAIGTDTSSPYSVNWNTGTLSDDSVWVRARAFDGMGYSDWNVSNSFKVDNTAPNTPSISESHCGPSWTMHNSPYFTWSNPGDSGSGVSGYYGSVDGGSAFSVSSGYHPTWGDGTHTFKIYAVDGVGLTSGWSNTITIYIDTRAPTTSDNAPSGWQTTKPITVTLTATDPSPGSGVAYTYYKKWLTTGTEPGWTVGTTISLNSDGIWNIKYKSVDNVGNEETPISKQVKIDTTPPSAPGTPTDAGTYSTSTTITFTWTAATDDLSGIVSYWLDVGTTVGGNDKYSGDVGNVLSRQIQNCEGGKTYYAKVKAKNGAERWGGWSGNSNGITVDLSIPSCSIHSIVEVTGADYLYVSGTTLYYNPNYASSFTIRVTASDTVSGLWKAVGSSAFGDTPTDTTPSAGSYQFELTYTIESGATSSGTLTITVYDVAGNTNTCSITVVRDNTGPTISLGSPPIVESSDYLHSRFMYGDILCNMLFYSNLMGSTAQSFKIQGTASDAHSGLAYGTASTAFGDTQPSYATPSSWSWTYTVVESDTGNDYIYVAVYDNVNNQATEKFYYYEDIQGPGTPILSPYDYTPYDSVYNGVVTTNRRLPFEWGTAADDDSGGYCSGLEYCKLQVDDDSSFASPYYEVLVSGASHTPGSDFGFTTHYWHVCTKDNVGNWGGWSNVWSFTVEQMYGVDLYPEDQKSGANPGTNVTFTITIDNIGNDYDIIDLETTEGVLSNNYVSLQYWETATVTLTLHMPEDAGDLCIVAAAVTGTSRNNATKYDTVTCSIATPPSDSPGIKIILPIQPGGVLPGDIIDGVHIGIDGHVAFPATTLDGDLDRLPGGRDGFCINSIIDIRDWWRELGGLPGFFPHPWYCDASNIYQTYYVNVSNPFNSTIIVNLSIYGVPDGWDAYLSNYSVTLEPGEYVIVTLTVIIPKTTTIGQTTVWVLGTIQDYDYLFMYGVNVTVGELPVAIARFESSCSIVLENDVLIFNGSYSYDPDGTIFSYEWDFGDGTNGTGMAVEHSYENTGNYVVTLIVRDNYNLTNSTTMVVSVERHSFEISVQQINTEIMPGETAVYMIEIRNTGTISDTYVLRMNNLDPSWSYPDNVYIGVSAGGSITLYLKVTVPSDYPLMENTTYSFTITVTCTHDPTVMSNAPLTYTANETLTVISTKESKTRYMINEVEDLMTMLDNMSIQSGVKNSLKSKLQTSLDKLNTALDDILNGDENHANNMLSCAQNKINAFINEVEAQRGKKISNEDADMLLDMGQTLINHVNETIGCD